MQTAFSTARVAPLTPSLGCPRERRSARCASQDLVTAAGAAELRREGLLQRDESCCVKAGKKEVPTPAICGGNLHMASGNAGADCD